jgi:hypothetical protein
MWELDLGVLLTWVNWLRWKRRWRRWWWIWCWHIGKDRGLLKARCLERSASAARGAMSGAEEIRETAYDVDIKRMLGHILRVHKGGRHSWL